MPALRRCPVGLVELNGLWRDARLDQLQRCLQVPTLDARGIYVFLQSTQRRFLADSHNLLSDGCIFTHRTVISATVYCF